MKNRETGVLLKEDVQIWLSFKKWWMNIGSPGCVWSLSWKFALRVAEIYLRRPYNVRVSFAFGKRSDVFLFQVLLNGVCEVTTLGGRAQHWGPKSGLGGLGPTQKYTNRHFWGWRKSVFPLQIGTCQPRTAEPITNVKIQCAMSTHLRAFFLA